MRHPQKCWNIKGNRDFFQPNTVSKQPVALRSSASADRLLRLYQNGSKTPENQLFHPIGTQCVIGVQLVRAKARRKLMHLSLRLAFYIRIELDRSNVDARSLQVHPDKVLCFQGLYGFWRECSSFLNDCKTIENTGQIGFLGISDDSSQIVVTVISLQKQHFRKNIKTRCLQNYKQRIFICRSITKIVSNHILSLLAAARKYTDKIETTSSDSG